MNAVKSIARNTGLLIAANIFSLAMGFVINVFIARYFDVENFGVINWAINLSTIFTLVTDLGISMYLVMELPRHPESLKSLLNNGLSIKFFMAMVALTGILTTGLLTDVKGDQQTVLFIIGLYTVVLALSQVFQSVFQAFQSMKHLSIVQVINGFVLAAGAVLVVALNLGVIAFAMVYLASGLIIFAYNVSIAMLFYQRPALEVNPAMWKRILIGGLPLGVAYIFSFLSFRIDIQMIEMMKGTEAVGFYSAAFKLIEAVICIPAMYNTVVFPIMSLYYHRSDSNLSLIIQKSVKYLFMLGMPIVVGTILLADKFIFLLYSEKYAPSIAVLQLLSIGLLLIFINYIPNNYLSATNMQVANIKIFAICIVINVVANLFLIPPYGIAGSAVALIITQIAMGICTYYLVRKASYSYPGYREFLKIVGCALIMGGFVYLAIGFNLALIVAGATVIYFVLLVLSGALSTDDLNLLSNIYKKKSSPGPAINGGR